MKISIIAIGKKHDSNLLTSILDYSRRLSHYTKIEWKLLESNSANMSIENTKRTESNLIMSHIKPDDYAILLDERGKQLNSLEYADMLQRHQNTSTKSLILIIGGAHGVDNDLKARANYCWSLSPLVFPHQLVRLILIEQLYRAFTIINNGKYHHY
ncbi:23S rRNA (pseudouridine(1915)-N(3))-methyltransferase RlmH [Candidatus Saccharibacteria bacterium]|nr:23S rRNA (pseudouridine(1915)-N(3))-methyltransferase RlmH [Candidatus Saccharibacteria bacterium]